MADRRTFITLRELKKTAPTTYDVLGNITFEKSSVFTAATRPGGKVTVTFVNSYSFLTEGTVNQFIGPAPYAGPPIPQDD